MTMYVYLNYKKKCMYIYKFSGYLNTAYLFHEHGIVVNYENKKNLKIVVHTHSTLIRGS